MSKLRVLDLFSGIGGFSLGLERTGGFETVAFCEIEEFPRKVLKKHWPEVPCYEDVRSLTADILERDGIAVDVITGGFPCQDLSVAGKLVGLDGERSGLWSEIVRLIRELRPRYVIVENVANLLSGPPEKRGGWFGRVLGDLAECGYDAEWENIPAAAVGAPHRRERVWLVAHAEKHRWKQGAKDTGGGEKRIGEGEERRSWHGGETVAHADSKRGRSGNAERKNASYVGKPPRYSWHDAKRMGDWRAEPNVGRVANGVPSRVDRLAGLGNAIVPQIATLIGRAILEAEA